MAKNGYHTANIIIVDLKKKNLCKFAKGFILRKISKFVI